MSQVGRRLAQKTSALGLAGTLAVFVGSVFALSSPAEAAAAEPLKMTYTCSGGYLSSNSMVLTATPPTSVEPSKTATIEWTFSSLTATKAIAANAVVTTSGGDLSVTGGTPATVKGSGNGTVTTPVSANGSYTPPKMTGTVNVTATAGGNLVLEVGNAPVIITVAGEQTTCTYVSATPTETSIPVQTGSNNGGTGTDVVEYRCVGPETTDTQDVEIKVELTMPTSASVNQQFAIKWKGTYTTGKELKAPSGQTLSPKIFAYASLSGITGLSSATGEGSTGTITANSPIPLPTTAIDVKATASAAGTVTVKPSKVNFGANSRTGNTPMIECTVQNEADLKTYTFTVSNSTTSPTPSPSPTTTTPRPTQTHTATVTITPSATRSTSTPTRNSQTPKAGADTGAGGMAGPDGRLFILTGTALVAAAAIGGLVLRRRSIRS